MIHDGRILVALAEGPLSAQALREKLHLSAAQMGKHLARLQSSPRVIRVADYQRTTGTKKPLYGLGSKPDAVFVRKENMPRIGRLEVMLERTRKALETPRTAVELQEILHRSKPAVQIYLRTLRESKPKQVYISSWRDTESVIEYAAPVYALGSKKDAKNPKRHTKRQWVKLLKDKERHDVYKARKRARAVMKAAIKKPQNIFSALGL